MQQQQATSTKTKVRHGGNTSYLSSIHHTLDHLSSDQLADRERGFSFQSEGPLDMRFDPTYGEPAWEWLARVEEQTLADTIYRYGEERFSRRIARRVETVDVAPTISAYLGVKYPSGSRGRVMTEITD